MRGLQNREAGKTISNTLPPQHPGIDQRLAIHKRKPSLRYWDLTQATRNWAVPVELRFAAQTGERKTAPRPSRGWRGWR